MISTFCLRFPSIFSVWCTITFSMNSRTISGVSFSISVYRLTMRMNFDALSVSFFADKICVTVFSLFQFSLILLVRIPICTVSRIWLQCSLTIFTKPRLLMKICVRRAKGEAFQPCAPLPSGLSYLIRLSEFFFDFLFRGGIKLNPILPIPHTQVKFPAQIFLIFSCFFGSRFF